MIKFKPKDLTDHGFSFHLPGKAPDGRKEEFVIFTSWGQDGKSSLVIVTCHRGGDCTVVYDSKKRVILATILTQVEKALTKWYSGGLVAGTRERERLDARAEIVMEKLVDKWQ